MNNEELYHLKGIKDTLDRHEKEAIVFYSEIRLSLVQIQKDLRDLQIQRTQDQKDIESLQKTHAKIENRLNYIYIVLLVFGTILI